MEKALVIIFIGVLVFLAHAFVLMFEKTKVPDILYLIIIGLIIGPVLQLVKPEHFGKVGHIFSTIALVVILFEGGLELHFDLLLKTIKGTLLLAVTSFLIAGFLLFLFFFYLAGYDLFTSLFVSSVLSGPAPSVVIPLMKQLKLSDRVKTILTLESGLGEALCILISLAIFETIKLKEVQTGKAIGGIISSFFISTVIGFLGGYFWSLTLEKIRKLGNSIFTTPSFVFIIYGLCEFLGYSGPIGVLAFSATLANVKLIKFPILYKRTKLAPIEHDNVEKLFFGEIVFLLKTFFFVYLGTNIKFTYNYLILFSVIVVLILLLSRMGTVFIALRRKNTSIRDASFISVMISKGLATAVLGSILVENNLSGGEEMQTIIYYSIVLSVIITSIFIFLLEKTKMKAVYHKIYSGYSIED